MASIYIDETDNSIYSLSANNSDNIVFIPGSAITGPSDAPVLCNSLMEFTSKFGTSAPEVTNASIGTAWDYATNLLIAGFPVLFRRITTNASDVSLVTKASADLKVTVTVEETPTEVVVGKIEELYGGTFGNTLNYSIIIDSLAIYLKIFKSVTNQGSVYNQQLESIKLISITASDTPATIKEKLLAKIGTGFNTDYVKLTVTDETNFDLVATQNAPLSGGTNASELEVNKMIPTVFNDLTDKYIYDVKFITAGGYYNTTYTEGQTTSSIDVVTPMVNTAITRGDCIAIPDIPIGTAKEDVYTYFTNLINTSYATSYAPWAYFNLDTNKTKWMPPSFIFLHTLARSIKSGNPLWNPPAGVRRATVPGIVSTEYEIGQTTIDQWQNDNPQFINPIMKIKNYGYVIYGQRTLYKNVDGSVSNRSALQELGVRITANEIKRKIEEVAISLTFEQNNVRTWNEFRGLMNPFLAQIQAEGGLNDYEVVMNNTTTTSENIDRNVISGIVRVNISRAAEDFKIGFELTSSSVTFADEDEYVIL